VFPDAAIARQKTGNSILGTPSARNLDSPGACSFNGLSPDFFRSVQPVSQTTLPPIAAETKRDQEAPYPEDAAGPRLELSERWLRKNLDGVAAAITLAGLALRLYVAGRNFLNPDEALHYLIIHQSNIWLTYKASLSNAHPPLIYLLLHAWIFLGKSELMLRMPSVLAGTAACWFGFKWVQAVAGDAAALIALVLLAFSPGTVILSAELRAYALLLSCMTAALFFLARALEEKSVRLVWTFSAFLYLAILSHYSALFFTASAGVYALARIADLRPPRTVVRAWIAGQAGAAALYGVLYVTHVSKLKGIMAVWGAPFSSAYFHSSDGNIIRFTASNTLNIFLFLFSERYAAWALLLAYVAGIAVLFARAFIAARNRTPGDRLGILFLAPFLAVWGAALIAIYPYAGTRHTAFLAPFAMAGAGYSISLLSRKRLWLALLISAVLMAIAQTGDKSRELNTSAGDTSPGAMAAAVRYMHASIPQGETVFVDYQSSLPATYYLCGPETLFPYGVFSGDYFDLQCQGNPVVSLRTWKIATAGFPEQFEKMARAHNLRPGDRVWLYQTGWGELLDAKLDRQLPPFQCLAPQHFGTGVVVIPFVVGPDDRPLTASSGCSH